MGDRRACDRRIAECLGSEIPRHLVAHNPTEGWIRQKKKAPARVGESLLDVIHFQNACLMTCLKFVGHFFGFGFDLGRITQLFKLVKLL